MALLLVYASIFLEAHSQRTLDLFKYISTIRTASKRHFGLGWKHYDQQFRLRLTSDPTGISFGNIDYELWLLYIGASASMYGVSVQKSTKKCFDFN
jgi:hypothetical protein